MVKYIRLLSLFQSSTSTFKVHCSFVFQVEVCELSTIYSNQEEIDSMVLMYLHYAATLDYKNAVVRTPGTDIFVTLLYHAHDIKLTAHLDTRSGKHQQLFNLSDLAKSTGEDTAALFLGSMCSAERTAPVPSKGKGRWDLDLWRRSPGFTRHSGNLVMTGESSLRCWSMDRVMCHQWMLSVPSCCARW